MKLIYFFVFIICQPAMAYDCSNSKSFAPFESVFVSISVDRFFWENQNGQVVQKTEKVCETKIPMDVGAYDIRGREEEWYYCFYQTERPVLECQTQFNGKVATIVVRPATVIRSYVSRAGARDVHAHIFLAPENDWSKYRDTFVRSLSFNLEKEEVILEAVSGGQGPSSMEDSFGVSLRYF